MSDYSKIIISGDSTMDMPLDFINENGVQVIPSYVNLGEKGYDDWPDITMHDLFRYHDESGKLPQTSSANPEDYRRHFEKFTSQGYAVVHISKSSTASSSWKNADMTAQEMENVFAVDSKNLSGGSGLLVMEALTCGITDVNEMVKHLEEYRDRIEGSFIIETLSYLKEGGRCSTLAALGANLLKLRPEIDIVDGVMGVGRKFRGNYSKCIDQYLESKLENLDNYKDDCIVISHTLVDPAMLQHAKDVIASKHFFKQIIDHPTGAAVACHCGPNTFGVFMIKKA